MLHSFTTVPEFRGPEEQRLVQAVKDNMNPEHAALLEDCHDKTVEKFAAELHRQLVLRYRKSQVAHLLVLRYFDPISLDRLPLFAYAANTPNVEKTDVMEKTQKAVRSMAVGEKC